MPSDSSKTIEHKNGGGKEIRTPGLRIANATLYQLSYTPIEGTEKLTYYPPHFKNI